MLSPGLRFSILAKVKRSNVITTAVRFRHSANGDGCLVERGSAEIGRNLVVGKTGGGQGLAFGGEIIGYLSLIKPGGTEIFKQGHYLVLLK
jgi:hypothetical protein